jgi:hypothetical protein
VKVNAATPNRLKALDSALRAGVPEAIIAVVNSMGDHVLDDELLYLARASKKTVATIFLATLAIENGINADYNRRVLGVHRSVLQGELDLEVRRLGGRNVLYKMTESILGHKTWKSIERVKNINKVDWIDAIEISMDFDNLILTSHIVSDFVALKPDDDEISLVARHLLARRSLLRKTTDWTLYGNILSKLAIATCKANIKLLTEIVIVASESYLMATNPKDCLRVQSLIKEENNIRILYHKASAYSHLRDYKKAITILDEVIKKLTSIDGIPQILDSEPDKKKNDKKFNADLAAIAIGDLTSTVRKIGQKAFLVSGTLLGYARLGTVLPHDKDIDIGVLGWQNKFDLLAALIETKRFHCNLQFLRESKSYIFPVLHVETGMTIDLFFYEERGDYYITGIDNPFGYQQEFAFKKFNITEVEFMGIKVFIPEEYELNLEENFGDWRTSDPGYISHLESPSMVGKGSLIHRLIGRLFLIQALKRQDDRKILRILRILTEINDETLSNFTKLNEAVRRKIFEMPIQQKVLPSFESVTP